MPLKDIKAVDRFLELDFSRTKELQSIVEVAAAVCECPFALITVLDDNHQSIAFGMGPDPKPVREEDSFCRYLSRDLMEVPDALADGRFIDNPLVTCPPYVRFYGGTPLLSSDGHMLGSLCVFDQKAKRLNENQKNFFQILARQVIQILELEHSIQLLRHQVNEIKQSEIKLRSFFESSVSSHGLIDTNFKVLTFNKTIQKLLRETLEVEISEGMDAREYVIQPLLPLFIAHYKRALGGETVLSEREIDAGGRCVCMQITYEPARSPKGDIIGVSYTSTDITERVRQNRLLLAKDESLRKIVFMQSHHLRGPVASILGVMKLIKSEPYYQQGAQELSILEDLTKELDQVVRKIVDQASEQEETTS
jgi:PAS domain S-box-containing protein